MPQIPGVLTDLMNFLCLVCYYQIVNNKTEMKYCII